LLEFARSLRRQQTDAETRLWRLLRDRRIQGMKFRRQHPIPPYVVDFYCHDARLIIEVDGGQHAGDYLRDQARTAFLEAKGFRVIRFWNNQVLTETEAVLGEIWRALIPAVSQGDNDALTPPLSQAERENDALTPPLSQSERENDALTPPLSQR